MKLIGCSKSKITKKMQKLCLVQKLLKFILTRNYCVNNNSEQKSRALHIFVPNKPNKPNYLSRR